MPVHVVTKGDTRTPLGATLKQPDTSGTLTAVDLTGLTIKFKMAADDGTTKVALTTDNVTVVSAANGQVQYDFQAADVDTAGRYYAWFVSETGGGEQDHYPHDGRSFSVVIHDDEADS